MTRANNPSVQAAAESVGEVWESAPPAAAQAEKRKREVVARAIWNLRREEEDRCDMELEDMGKDHPVWDQADAAIAALAPSPIGTAEQAVEGVKQSLTTTAPAVGAPVADSIIAGALFDLMGDLTSGEIRYRFSSYDDAAPAVKALEKFAAKRGLSLKDANVSGWREAIAPPAASAEGVTAVDLDDLMRLHKNSTAGKWQQGQTSHHTVSKREGAEPYRVAEFRHAADASFCDAAHEWMPKLIAAITAPHAASLREQELSKALEEAATSLQTIANCAGNNAWHLESMAQIRGYAKSRSQVAFDARRLGREQEDWKAIARVQSAKLDLALDKPGASEREAFVRHIQATEQRMPLLWLEVWANSMQKDPAPVHLAGKYFMREDQKAWQAWQARAALAAAPKAAAIQGKGDEAAHKCTCGLYPHSADCGKADERGSAEPFVVHHYAGLDRPSIKGNGFDGLEIGDDREEAEVFVNWVNARITGAPERK